ncbi:hypothetical protein GCM10010532_096910 [Dactylosporangium siamense]|uniref:Transposase n=1 Tax=Dactylosporangium siamense TaxID=685454 RepID=A0A919PWW5_9ACTN|nr:hypothetical protein Dsi01nite_080240 [Dactylosporangium siamense]
MLLGQPLAVLGQSEAVREIVERQAMNPVDHRSILAGRPPRPPPYLTQEWFAAKRPQGGGKRRADDLADLAAIASMVQAGCSWRKPPAAFFGVFHSTVHRRFTVWTRFREADLATSTW